MRKLSGFHLIEILITLTIISILTALLIPIYTNYFVQTKRIEAAMLLSQLALAIEKYYIENNTYREATLSLLHFPEVIIDGNYRLSIRQATNYDYLLAAKPLGKQATRDNRCKTLLLSSTGKKMVTGKGTIQECW
jgi:type IV pilus assembly protein PilE